MMSKTKICSSICSRTTSSGVVEKTNRRFPRNLQNPTSCLPPDPRRRRAFFTTSTSCPSSSSLKEKRIIIGVVEKKSLSLSNSAAVSQIRAFCQMASSNGHGPIISSSFPLSPTSSLKIQKGDITKWFVDGASDAIVNAANEMMLGGGGVDGAIHNAAGPELRSACRVVPEVRPGVRCPKGEARITGAFRLPVAHVIHTVGPIYDVDDNPRVTLWDAYRNCLRLAKENNIQYIAFPAISCGVYGYPYDEAAAIAISAVQESSGDLKEVHFVLFQDDIFNVWLDAARMLL